MQVGDHHLSVPGKWSDGHATDLLGNLYPKSPSQGGVSVQQQLQ